MVSAEPARAGWGVRRTSVLIAVGVVFLALLGGGALLVLVLQSALRSTTEDETTNRAGEIAAFASQSGLRQAVSEVRSDSRPAQLLQIVSSSGQVIAASRPAITERPLSPLAPQPGGTATATTDIRGVGATDDFLVAAQGVTVDGRSYVVQVAAPLQIQAQTVRTVALFLLGATPALLLVVGVAVWVLVGRALEPVEVIRRQVSSIDARRLGQRVAVPGTRDEIAALASTMNVMLDRLEASDRAQRSFVSDASHELRSPLSTVITAAEVSATDPTGAQWRQRLDSVLVESRRMRFLVDNLMTLAKADSGDLALQTEDVDLDDLVASEVELLRRSSRHRVVVDVRPSRTTGDPRRLTQVVRNLLENADRHARSTIAVSLSDDSHQSVLNVDNDGEVIEESMRERVFERFVRLDDSRSRDSGGSGLGLAISSEIIRAHGGTITAGESPEGWCRFQILLPTEYTSHGGELSPGSATVGDDGEHRVRGPVREPRGVRR